VVVAAPLVINPTLAIKACLLPLVKLDEELVEALDDEGEDRNIEVLVD